LFSHFGITYSIESALSYTRFVVITGDLNVNLLSDRPHILKDKIVAFNFTNVRVTDVSMTLIDPLILISDIDSKPE